MIQEFIGVCSQCGEEVKSLINDGKIVENCGSCGRPPFQINNFEGVVYVVYNKVQPGVKIGRTHDIRKRLKSLRSAGTLGDFKVAALFPCRNSRKDEKKLHEKFKKFRLEREHFDLEPNEAVLKCFRALNRREPIFHDASFEQSFRRSIEDAKIKMKLQLTGSALGGHQGL